MNDNPQNNPNSESEDEHNAEYTQRRQEIQLHEEELRLLEEERRIRQGQRRLIVHRFTQSIYFLVGALESLLILRFILRLAGANPENFFAQIIYGISAPFVSPFLNLS
ncbi:MAG TPA: YggT family protein [Cyanothece sp. UBA12306]|nr:YggT family protein [Cyanothece sp. UBA12306]